MRSTRPLRPAHKLRRHTIVSTSVAAGVALGLVLTGALTAASASADLRSTGADSLAAMTAVAPWAQTAPAGAQPISRITADARATLEAAQRAIAAANVASAQAAASGLDLGAAGATVDTKALQTQIERLTPLDGLPLFFVPAVTDKTAEETQNVLAQTASLRAHLDAAKAKKAAEIAAAKAKKAAQEAAAKKKREVVAIAAANTPAGAKAAARQIAAAEYGWGDGQFSCLVSLWSKESGWNYRAYNAGSGATGIPQALPGSKMSSIAPDWRTNAKTQIRWGLRYIAGSYGSPCGAWAHSQATNWY